MKLNQLFHIYILLLMASLCFGQAPVPCGPEGEMQPFCEDACIICDIDGFNGINDENENGTAPFDFCTTIEHNIQWIAFIAGSENLTLEMTVGDCIVDGQGWGGSLEVGIYEGIDCDNFQQVTECNTDIQAGTSWAFQNDVPLVVGQYYFLVMDGSGGSVCEYSIAVLDGSTNVQALEPTGPIEAPPLMCANQAFTLSFEPQLGATIYQWTVNGILSGVSDSLELNLPDAGVYEICINEANACDAAAASCTTIEVMPQIQELRNLVICEGDSVIFYGETYKQAGVYPDILVPADEGCDSLLTLNLEFGAIFEGSDFYNICDGDTLFLDGEEHFETGIYDHFLLTEKGCDSVVHVNLLLVVCNMVGSADPTHLLCHGDGATGSFTFRITAGTPPFTYDYFRVLDTDINGSGSIASDFEDVRIDGLPAGSYLINVYDDFGNFTIINVEILEPTAMENQFTVSDYNGFNISCFNGSNGEASAAIVGGTPGYQYAWDTNPSTEEVATDLEFGLHVLSVTDENDCLFMDTVLISQPEAIEGVAELINPNCDDLLTGEIFMAGISGGVPGFEFSINDEPFEDIGNYTALAEGDYRVLIKDANDCLDTLDLKLVGAQIPTISFSDDLTINLGDSIELEPIINDINIANIDWSGEENISCIDCRNPYAFPYFNSSYTIQVSSEDGCVREETINVFVEKDRNVYKPNIFSPALNDENGYFFITGGNQIKHIRLFNVFDRWGNNVYKGEMLNHKDPSQGWDGLFNGRDAMSGVYFWVAEVVYLDDVFETFAGDFTLIR